MKTIKDSTTFEELLDIKHGKSGTPERDKFEAKSKSFIVGEMVKEAKGSIVNPRRYSK